MEKELSKIILTKQEMNDLKLLKRKKKISDDSIRKLSAFSFVDRKPMGWNQGRSTGFDYSISADGLRYLEYRKDIRSERRWTRIFSIIAIVISLAALFLELQDRGYIPFF